MIAMIRRTRSVIVARNRHPRGARNATRRRQRSANAVKNLVQTDVPDATVMRSVRRSAQRRKIRNESAVRRSVRRSAQRRKIRNESAVRRRSVKKSAQRRKIRKESAVKMNFQKENDVVVVRMIRKKRSVAAVKMKASPIANTKKETKRT